MTPAPLYRPFIGIILHMDDYSKVKGLLATPSYTDILHSYSNQKIILIYALEGYLVSPSQYKWISNIKLGVQNLLCIPLEFEDEFHITDTTDITSNLYTIDELSKAFKAPLITYPKIMYPATKEDLYRRLCWYGIRLIHQKLFTKECLTATALLMNKKLNNKYGNKDLHKKVLGAYTWVSENKSRFKVKLNDSELKKAHSKGARTKNLNQAQKTKVKVQKLVKSGKFYKPNGKVNISLLAKAMGMNRKTIAKYIRKREST